MKEIKQYLNKIIQSDERSSKASKVSPKSSSEDEGEDDNGGDDANSSNNEAEAELEHNINDEDDEGLDAQHMLAYLEQRDLSQLDRWSRERWSLSSVSSCWNKLIHRWSNDDFRRVLRAAERDVHTAEVFVNVETMEQRASAYRTAAVLCRWQKL